MNSQHIKIKQNINNFWNSVLLSGLIIGGILIVYDLIFSQLLNASDNSIISLIGSFITPVAIYYTQVMYRTKYCDGHISYGNALKFGTLAMAATGIIRGFYFSILLKVKPSIWSELVLKVEEAYYNLGVSDSQVEALINPVRNGISPVVITMSFILTSIIIGFFISLITSIIVSKNNDTFNNTMSNIE